MNLAKITRLARRRYRQVVGDGDIRGAIVPIACYLDEKSYRQVCDDDATFFEHWAIIALFGEMAAKRGAFICYMPIVPEDYFDWCEKNKLQNSTGTRARYAQYLATGIIDGITFQQDDLKE
jgi:hypothetical protein